MSKSLAIVDDQSTVIETLVDHFKLTLPNLKVDSYCGGKEIVQALREGKQYSAVLMDGKLVDGYTGPKYTANIVALCPQTVVIGFSSEERLQSQFIEKGARIFLPKASSMKEIDRVIISAIGI